MKTAPLRRTPAPLLRSTVRRTAELSGVGLHSGVPTILRLKPALPETGIRFVRIDLPNCPEIMVSPEAVDASALQRRTALRGEGGAEVATIEHLLAACLALGLDDVRIELDGPEVPIMDGSAAPFVALIQEAGLETQQAARRVWRLRRGVSLAKNGAEIIAVPAEQMSLAFFADLQRGGFGVQSAFHELDAENFAREIAPARTFVYEEDIEALRAAGLIRGGSLDCALVLRQGMLVRGAFRLPEELARHKLLDLIGDLAVLGRPIQALITARGTGHALHYEFIQALRKELEG